MTVRHRLPWKFMRHTHYWTSPQESDNFPRFVAIFAFPHRQSVPELCLQDLQAIFLI
jgi:hypothetical protein